VPVAEADHAANVERPRRGINAGGVVGEDHRLSFHRIVRGF
jgi:hypothetical protein